MQLPFREKWAAPLTPPSTGIQENFVQSELWKKKYEQFSTDKIVLPLYVFYDDCECNNPLGSHTDKLGCT